MSFDRHFSELPIVGILRGFERELMPNIIAASQRGGLRLVEITMNSPAAVEQIQDAVRVAGGELSIGAGTVTRRALLGEALSAGASFIVTPTINAEVIAACVDRGIPIFPGALSPGEVITAWELGATAVKIFPAEAMGAGYIKALRGPFPHVPLMPTGGVGLNTLHEFKSAGAVAFGIGTPLFEPARIRAGDWNWLEKQCRAFVDEFHRS